MDFKLIRYQKKNESYQRRNIQERIIMINSVIARKNFIVMPRFAIFCFRVQESL